MIYVYDAGQLCNNIIQYAHVYSWGREHGRQTMSMRFAYKYQWFNICNTKHHHFLTYLWAKYASKWGWLPTIDFGLEVTEKEMAEKEKQMLANRNCIVKGWGAHWHDLFFKYKQEIINLFSFIAPVENKISEIIQDKAENGIDLGLHIRRGDYKVWHEGRFFYSDEQYIQILKDFVALYPHQEIRIFICSNDPSIDQDYFRRSLLSAKLVFPNGNPGEDLCLLSKCDYLIGPPSTFSLVASMYQDSKLYWIEDPQVKISENSFRSFNDLIDKIW